ncbi:MAG: T9SS type A sorting domain-containing protein [Crocinitomicaceae bacterium]|nr:T9SS type A sorting domain-containing protein [Crocinitomicaceae bacterium]
MKKISLLFIPFIIVACSKQQQTTPSEENNNQHEFSDDVMSEGDYTDPGSRRAWEYMRLANPNTGMIPANIRRRELEFAATLPAKWQKAYSWDRRGPVNVGGRTRAFAFDVQNENVMLAGGVTGGIWRSQDAGQSWSKVTDDLDAHSITSIVQDTRPGHENTWYAGTGEHYAIVSQTTFESRYSGNGVLKSTDGGLTWSPLTSTQSNTPQTYLSNGDMDFVWRMVIDPTDMVNDVVFAAVYNGVYRSEDGGATWTQVLGFNTGGFSNPACNYLDLVVTSTGVFYCTMSSDGPDKGFYRSDDGINWTNITPAGYPSSYGRMTMAINPLNENVVWMFGASSTGFGNNHGVFRYEYLSGDGSGAGGAFSDRSAALPDQSCTIVGLTTDLAKLNTQSSFDVHIGIHPTDTATIYIAGTSIWRNNDAFTHDSTNKWIGGYQCNPLPIDSIDWTLSYPNHHPDQHLITFLPSDPNTLININDGGIYKTVDDLADSVEWIPLNNGYVTTQFYALAIEPGEATSDIIISGAQDNGTWFTNSAVFDTTWKYIGSGDGMYCALANGGDYYITCKQRGKMYLKQIDANGNVLAHERIDPENGPLQYNWANSLKLDPNNDSRLFWNGRTYLWRTDSLAYIPLTMDKVNKEPNYWLKIDSSMVDPGAGIISDIEMCVSDSGKVWYGTANGRVYRLDNAYANLPDTPHKVNITGDDFPTGSYVSCVAVNPFDSDKIVVTFANYEVPSIFITNDGGQTWEDISGNLEENSDGSGAGPAVFWAEYYVDGTIFVGTSTGLYTTTFPDTTNTVWTLEPGIGNVPVDHMDFRTYDGFFAVATHGLGIFSTHLPSGFIGVEETSNEELFVYPVPATDVVNIVVPKEAKTIEIYDLTGRRMLQENLTGNFQLNISNYPPGTYIVVVRSSQSKWTKKLVKH